MLDHRDDGGKDISKLSVMYPISIYCYYADNILLTLMNPCPVRKGRKSVEGEGEKRVIGQKAR